MKLFLTNARRDPDVEDNLIRVESNVISAYFQITQDQGGIRDYKPVRMTVIYIDGHTLHVKETPSEIEERLKL
jgi:hypothetical protein